MSRCKAKVVRKTLSDPNVVGLFQNVLGGDGNSMNFPLAYKKYAKVRSNIFRYIKLINTVRQAGALSSFPRVTQVMEAFLNALNSQVEVAFSVSHEYEIVAMTQAIDDHTNIPEDERERFKEIYPKMSDNIPIKSIMVTCEFLTHHRVALEKIEKALTEKSDEPLDDSFVVQFPGLKFSPIGGMSTFNFKQVYISDKITTQDRKFLMLMLCKLYSISHETYNALLTPDIDVDEFVTIVRNSIGEVRKQLPRCGQALDHIINSVHMLKSNFGTYYRDFVISKNPSVLLENFVVDVSKTTGKVQPNLTRQFREIISFYRKMSANQKTDPRLRGLLQRVNENIGELDKRFRQMEKNPESVPADEMGDLVPDEGDDEPADAAEEEDVESVDADKETGETEKGGDADDDPWGIFDTEAPEDEEDEEGEEVGEPKEETPEEAAAGEQMVQEIGDLVKGIMGPQPIENVVTQEQKEQMTTDCENAIALELAKMDTTQAFDEEEEAQPEPEVLEPEPEVVQVEPVATEPEAEVLLPNPGN
jgi:hypothetical protein